MGKGVERACVNGDFALLLTMAAGRGAKADMADTGSHGFGSWTLPLALGIMGFWAQSFETE